MIYIYIYISWLEINKTYCTWKILKRLTEGNEPTSHMICMARQGKKKSKRRNISKFSEPYVKK